MRSREHEGEGGRLQKNEKTRITLNQKCEHNERLRIQRRGSE